ncbi:MAG: OsmC family protein [Planctomycetota bacterium]|jgi:putative redox protein|nr:OsmC family protein [Planctomycetota bacterium]MDG1406007.1 OsmC family protein [Planctomycetota bacterium]MDG2310494.1 OsmC family protein [Planctomycetota bacterium]
MSVSVEIAYEGQLRCKAIHGPSQCHVITDAPVDNHGKGAHFSPTDLVATALGTCTLTLLGIVADRHGISLEGTTVKVEKHMVAEPVRRIGRLPVDIYMGQPIEDKYKDRLVRAAETCPVKQSVHPDIDLRINFHWK